MSGNMSPGWLVAPDKPPEFVGFVRLGEGEGAIFVDPHRVEAIKPDAESGAWVCTSGAHAIHVAGWSPDRVAREVVRALAPGADLVLADEGTPAPPDAHDPGLATLGLVLDDGEGAPAPPPETPADPFAGVIGYGTRGGRLRLFRDAEAFREFIDDREYSQAGWVTGVEFHPPAHDPGLATSPPMLSPGSRWRNAAGSVATVRFVADLGGSGRDRISYTTTDDAGRISSGDMPADRFRELYPEFVGSGIA